MTKSKDIYPHFADFAYSGGATTEELEAIMATRETILAPSGAYDDISEQRLATYVTVPTNLAGPELITRATAWSDDNGRPSGAAFDAAIAHATGRRVIAVNAPGVDTFTRADNLPRQELTPDQIEDLKRGSFVKVGAAVAEAYQNAALIHGESDPSFYFTASSMGSAFTAGMIRHAGESGMKVRGVTLAETVNTDRVKIPTFGKRFIDGQTHAPGYLEMNPQVVQDLPESKLKWLLRVSRDAKANWLYAGAMAHGRFLDDLGTPDHLEGIPVYLSRGAGSPLTNGPALEAIRNAFPPGSVEAETFGHPVENPHDHGYTLTTESVVAALKKVVS